MILGAVLLIAGLVGALWLWRMVTDEKARASRVDDETFERAKASVDGALTKSLLDLAKPLTGLPAIQNAATSGVYKQIEQKLAAAGGLYGGNVEVFLAYQGLFIILAVAVGLIALSGVLGTVVPPILWVIVVPVVAMAPYQSIDKKSRERVRDITSALPEFAELLQMPLSAGLSVLHALEFTSLRTDGVVSTEVKNMLTLIRSRTVSETEAFSLAGDRLGTPEARTFFQALQQGHVEGAKTRETIAKQAEALRNAMFQQRRADIKKIPMKLVMAFGAHFIPLVFILILVPAVSQFSTI